MGSEGGFSSCAAEFRTKGIAAAEASNIAATRILKRVAWIIVSSIQLKTSKELARWQAEALDVLLQDARVHHHGESRAPRLFGGLVVDDALLHPHGLRADANRALHHSGHVFRAAEDVHDVHLVGNIFQARVAFLAEDFALVWIHRNDAVARGLQIFRYAVAW